MTAWMLARSACSHPAFSTARYSAATDSLTDSVQPAARASSVMIPTSFKKKGTVAVGGS